MGYYTETHFKFTLREDTPQEVLDLLEKVINNQREFYASLLPGESELARALREGEAVMMSVADTPNLPIDHQFGKCTRWDQFLSGSFVMKSRRLEIDSDIKAYDGEPYKFLAWLAPYIVKKRRKKGTYLGWHKGEESGQIHHYLEKVLGEHSFLYK